MFESDLDSLVDDRSEELVRVVEVKDDAVESQIGVDEQPEFLVIAVNRHGHILLPGVGKDNTSKSTWKLPV